MTHTDHGHSQPRCRTNYIRAEIEVEPFFATRAVMESINEEQEWARHRKEIIAIEMSVVRASDLEPKRRGVRRPMTMTNLITSARAVDIAFYGIRWNGQDGNLATLDQEKLPEGSNFLTRKTTAKGWIGTSDVEILMMYII